jgi:tetratricopeptide (TPR) repeat protein
MAEAERPLASWLIRHRDWLAPLGVFVLALALRLIYYAEIAEMPFVLHPVVDARAYDEWAQRIAAGAWWGDQAFYQAPAYPYFLAVIYGALGRDLALVHVIQMVMGAASCVLMFGCGRLLFGFGTGLCAGLMLAAYPPAIFFDGIIGKAGLGLFLLTGLLALLLAHQRAPRAGRALLAGAVLGLLALTRENALALAPALPVWLWLRFRDRPAALRARWLACFVAGLASVLLFVGLRNYLVGDTFALTTSQMGTNFYIGNSPEATGLYVPLIAGRHTPVYEATDAALLAERALGRDLTRGEVSDYWMSKGLAFVRDDPLGWLRLMVIKLALTWNAFEIADTEDIYVYADWSALLRRTLPLWHFGLLAPLAAAGVVLAWRERRDFWLLAWLALVYTGSVALFITFARFRFPLVPMLMPLAAVAVVRSASLYWSGRPRELLAPACAFVACALFVNFPILEEERFLVASYANLGGIMLNQDRPEEAAPYLERAYALDTENADLRFHMAVLAYKRGELPQAEAHVLRMIELEPTDFRGPRLLAMIYRQTGRPAQARVQARKAFALNPDREVRRK